MFFKNVFLDRLILKDNLVITGDRDIHRCQTKTAGNNLEIACNLSKSGQHKVLMISRSSSSTALGEFKFTATVNQQRLQS